MHCVRLLLVSLSFAAIAPAKIAFNRDVRPILSDRCFACHGPDAANKKISLRLDSEVAAKADLGGRFAIKPGDPDGSELIRRITEPKPARRMPPVHTGSKLTDTEIATLRQWIVEGAEWQRHWSLVPPTRPETPKVKDPSWVSSPIDAFVLSRLEREGLKPSAQAERVTLLRRLSFDLTGLPPTPAEADAFIADRAPDAYERQVDRLLKSPRFGERMAIKWLDAARYADTNGYQTDAERHMWRWRDWVIEAFNQNKPFDQFTREQIAGDLLPKATLDQKIATGFNRNHRGNSEGGIVPEEYLAEYAVDRVDTMSTVFLGMTLGCARCHNHKYDPFTQREYYQLFAYFNSIPEIGRYLKYGNTPPYIKAPTAEQARKLSEFDGRLRKAESHFASLRESISSARNRWEKGLAKGSDWAPTEGLEAHEGFESESVAGVVGKAAAFTGNGERSLGNKGAFGFYDKFTAAAWVRTEGRSGPIVTRADTQGEGEGWALELENGKLQVNLIKRRLDDSIRVETVDAFPAGEWHHVAMTYDGSRLASGVRIYVDGRPQKLNIILDAINQDFLRKDQPLRVGSGGVMEAAFQGSIDEVRVYGRALLADEVEVLAVTKSLAELAAVPENRRTEAEKRKLALAYLEQGATESHRAAWTQLRAAQVDRERFVEQLPTVMVMEELPSPKKTHILLRGAYDQPGEEVSRGVPEVLGALPPGAPPNRLGLADWLTRPDHPLLARVTVNRFWQMLFGTGLVKTVEDFGSQGEWPSHPDLLDWLATEFVRSGWDTKALLKTIVMSSTYRQASSVSAELQARDPENRLLARGPRLRLGADAIRDTALAASGLLVERLGGPSVKPYQPAGLWSELGDKDYERDKGEGLYRRSLYTYWKRTAPPPFAMNFDAAGRESCVVRDSRTNTPLQALNLMNDVTFVEASRVLAQKAMVQTGLPDSRIHWMFRSLITREPNEKEKATLRRSLEWFREHFQARPEAVKKLLQQGDTPVDITLAPAELAAYASVASLILNLDEAITKE
jgi:hypothetical protein